MRKTGPGEICAGRAAEHDSIHPPIRASACGYRHPDQELQGIFDLPAPDPMAPVRSGFDQPPRGGIRLGGIVLAALLACAWWWASATPRHDIHSQLRTRLIESELGSAVYLNFATAAKPPDASAASTDDLIAQLRSAIPDLRWFAADALAERGEARVVDALIRAMRDPVAGDERRQTRRAHPYRGAGTAEHAGRGGEIAGAAGWRRRGFAGAQGNATVRPGACDRAVFGAVDPPFRRLSRTSRRRHDS